MRWVKPSKLPVLIAWMAIIGVIVWLVSNPHYMAPYVSRMVGRHLLGMEEGGLQVRDFRVRVFEGMDLYGVSLTLPSASGGMTLASADTVIVDFQAQDLLGIVPKLRRVIISRPEIFSRAGQPGDPEPDHLPVKFPRLEIEHLAVTDAYLEFSGADGRMNEEISHLDWSGSIHSDEEVVLDLHDCDVNWDSRQSLLEGLRGRLVIDQDKAQAMPVFGTFNGKDVRVTGSRHWMGDLDIAVLAEGVSTPEVEELIDMSIGFKAAGDIVGTLVVIGDTLDYQGIFTGDLEGFQVTDLECQAIVGPDDVVLPRLSGEVNGAKFEGKGYFDISRGDSVSFVLDGDVEDVDVAKGLIPGEEDLPVTHGGGRMKIEHTDLPLWTRVTGVLNDGFIEVVPFDTCYVDIEALGETVNFNLVEIFYQDLHAVVSGQTDSDQFFTGSLSAASENMATLPEQWGWPTLDGRFIGQGQLNGPLDNLEFSGWISLYNFWLAQGHLGAGRTEALLTIADALEDPVVNAAINGRDLVVGGVPLGQFKFDTIVSAEFAQVDSFHTAYGDTSASFSLGAAFSDTLQHFLLHDYRVELEGTEWAISDPVDFAVGDGVFHLPHLLLESDQGSMAVEANFQRDTAVSGNLVLDRFDLGLLDPFVENSLPLTGLISADVIVGGRPEDPVVNLTLDLTDSTFDLARVDSLHVAASFNQGTLEFQELDLHSEYGRLTGAGLVSHPDVGPVDYWPGAALDLDLQVVGGDWDFLDQFQIPALDRLKGSFDGKIQLTGTTVEPLIEGSIVSAPFHVHWLHLDQLEGNIWADSETLVLADLKGHKKDLRFTGRIEIPSQMDLISSPVTPLDQPFYMQLEIPPGTNLAPLWEATNAFAQSSGTGQAHVIVSGPLDHPFYQGSVQLRDAGFVLRDMEEIYSETSCDGVFQGDVLTVRNIKGREGLKGTFEGEGTVNFKGLVLESFDIDLVLDRFLVASIPDLRAVVSSQDARMTSVYVGPDSLLVPRFTGNFEILKARYTSNFKEKEGAVDPMAPTVSPDWVGEMKLHGAPRTVRIINREMELYLGGDLDLVRNESGMFLRGALDVNSGRLIVFNNTFKVVRGRLDLSQELGFDPRIDLDATTSYRMRSQVSNNSINENIQVHVSGTVVSPEITFNSDRGYSREAIQRMLLGLEPFSASGSDGQSLTNTSISAGFNVIEREIAREIEIFDTFEIDQIQRQRETGAELDPLIGVGKYIGKDVYLKLAQGIRQDDRDILVEYQINDHLLLQSEVRRRIDENEGNETYNLDLMYRFEY